jgi:hypothetical protein
MVKNTLRVIATLLLAVFAGTFVVAAVNKKIRQKNLAKNRREPAAETVIAQEERAAPPVKPLF